VRISVIWELSVCTCDWSWLTDAIKDFSSEANSLEEEAAGALWHFAAQGKKARRAAATTVLKCVWRRQFFCMVYLFNDFDDVLGSRLFPKQEVAIALLLGNSIHPFGRE
jgi:hypothetical protein